MIARLLHQCGLYLGVPGDLISGSPSNIEGHWEFVPLVLINDRVLEAIGGGWDLPGVEPVNWDSEVLSETRSQARDVVCAFQGMEPWGWKDPRNSITLPFWRSLLPDLKVVIVLRNPLETMESLCLRNNSSLAFAANLWALYYERILENTSREDRIVTHYEAYFGDGRAELERLLRFVGLSAPAVTLQRALSAASPTLWHNRSDSLPAWSLPDRICELYQRLCAEADWPRAAQEVPGNIVPSMSIPASRPTNRYRRIRAAVVAALWRSFSIELQRRDDMIFDLQSQLRERIASAAEDRRTKE
jgi:hypothetical protein